MLTNPAETARAVSNWIRDYFDQNCPKGRAVVGISGGKDSAVTAALCARALGKDRVAGVLMPDGAQKDIADSEAVVRLLGIPSVTINIAGMHQAFRDEIAANSGFAALTGRESLSRDSEINCPARLRMATLYAVAQSLPGGALVINTCNKSEDWVGYSTKFGDSTGDLSPLAVFTVTEVRQLGSALGLPDSIVRKTPSDGLSGLSDEAKLGFTYEQLDRLIETGECGDPALKAKIDRMHAANLHKLQPMPHFPSKD